MRFVSVFTAVVAVSTSGALGAAANVRTVNYELSATTTDSAEPTATTATPTNSISPVGVQTTTTGLVVSNSPNDGAVPTETPVTITELVTVTEILLPNEIPAETSTIIAEAPTEAPGTNVGVPKPRAKTCDALKSFQDGAPCSFVSACKALQRAGFAGMESSNGTLCHQLHIC
jgi:hypothetical protein